MHLHGAPQVQTSCNGTLLHLKNFQQASSVSLADKSFIKLINEYCSHPSPTKVPLSCTNLILHISAQHFSNCFRICDSFALPSNPTSFHFSAKLLVKTKSSFEDWFFCASLRSDSLVEGKKSWISAVPPCTRQKLCSAQHAQVMRFNLSVSCVQAFTRIFHLFLSRPKALSMVCWHLLRLLFYSFFALPIPSVSGNGFKR